MRIIGLTGPIAAGKDAAAKILKRHGAYIIDVDRTAHQLYTFQSPLWQKLVRAFGSKILSRGGEINRRKLGEIVFADKTKLAELNKIVHPYLREEIGKLVESRKQNTEHKSQIVVINAALLAEIGLVELVDEVWLVMASREARRQRLIKAGLAKEAAGKRLNSQVAQKDYLRFADVVIRNDGTLKQLNAEIQAQLEI